ncbi:hypothetical protein ACFQX7_28000 [Luedemannella flava]
MNLRDEIERVLRSWDAHERQRGATPIIDYDFCPTDDEAEPAGSRLEVYERLGGLLDSTDPVGNRYIISRLNADLAYLRALMGERDPLPTYIAQTQGCAAAGWSPDYVTAVGALARDELSAFDIPWDASTSERWEKLEGPLTVDDAATAIRRATNQYEPAVREVVGTTAPFDLAIETVNVDAYWAYWLDGAGSNARLRLNLRHARFTEVVARQFAFHEVLGHALQGASMYARASQDDVPWVRLLSVHAPQQVLFEGLAQALPLFVVPDDESLQHECGSPTIFSSFGRSYTSPSTPAHRPPLAPPTPGTGCRSGTMRRSLTRSATAESTRNCARTYGHILPGSTGLSDWPTMSPSSAATSCTPPIATRSPRRNSPPCGPRVLGSVALAEISDELRRAVARHRPPATRRRHRRRPGRLRRLHRRDARS